MGECELKPNPRWGVEYRIARKEDSEELAPKLRSFDRRECAAVGMVDTFKALEVSRAGSDICYAVSLNKELAMLVGVTIPLLGGEGSIWALGSDLLFKYPRAMLEEGRKGVKHFLSYHSRYSNYIGADNELTMCWLKHLGFRIGEPEPFGVSGQLFRKIIIGDNE